MVTAEQRKLIDDIWQAFYNGGMSVSSTIIDQLCVLMFIKMLDDKQAKVETKALKLHIELKDDNLTFKSGDWENPETGVKVPYSFMRWSNFKHLNPNELSKRVRDYCYPFIKTLSESSDDVFSKFLGDVTYGFDGKQDVLVKVVDMMSSIDFTDNDAMGDFFEHLIDGKLNGQFRTPRHIIDMMVEMIKPQLHDKIIDPAMGTAGFLIESAKYIKEHNKEELLNKENRKFFSEHQFAGVDTEPIMTRIGCMNLSFHDVAKPNLGTSSLLIEQNNAKHIGQYDIVLANPPFKGSLDADLTDPRILAVTKTGKTELLFVALFTKLLKVGGKCASIVPDGVLFGAGKAYQNLRRELVENQKLIAVVSMPGGIFQPYSGVKTSFILFEKTNHGGTDNVWFFDMQADGYSLDAKREQSEDNDIPEVLARFSNLDNELARKRTEQSFFVPIDELRNNNYDLSIGRYKKTVRKKVIYRSSNEICGDIVSEEKMKIQYMNNFRKMLGLSEIKAKDLFGDENEKR